MEYVTIAQKGITAVLVLAVVGSQNPNPERKKLGPKLGKPRPEMRAAAPKS